MPNQTLLDELREVFTRHGHPSYEEPGWAAVVSLQVLMMQKMEIIMSTIQDLATKSASEASALVDLNSAVAAFIQGLPAGTATGTPGQTVLNADDQAKLDTANATIDSNIGKIGEVKALLSGVGQPGAATPAPASAGPVSSGPPIS